MLLPRNVRHTFGVRYADRLQRTAAYTMRERRMSIALIACMLGAIIFTPDFRNPSDPICTEQLYQDAQISPSDNQEEDWILRMNSIL